MELEKALKKVIEADEETISKLKDGTIKKEIERLRNESDIS
jgi:hypothetical protein